MRPVRRNFCWPRHGLFASAWGAKGVATAQTSSRLGATHTPRILPARLDAALTRQTSSSSISGAGFGTEPRAISSLDFGATLPYLTRFGGLREAVAGLQALLYTSAEHDAHVRRQLVLLETLVALEDAAPTARYHRLAQQT